MNHRLPVSHPGQGCDGPVPPEASASSWCLYLGDLFGLQVPCMVCLRVARIELIIFFFLLFKFILTVAFFVNQTSSKQQIIWHLPLLTPRVALLLDTVTPRYIPGFNNH